MGVQVLELLNRYEAGPARLRESLAGMSEDELRYKYDPAKWSAKEIAIHVADMEVAATFRMKRVIAEPGARYPGVDQDLWAASLGYQDREVEPSLRLLEALRAEMSALLRRLPPDVWNQSGVHDQAGEQTLADLVVSYTEHLEKHVGQIEAIRQRLGK